MVAKKSMRGAFSWRVNSVQLMTLLVYERILPSLSQSQNQHQKKGREKLRMCDKCLRVESRGKICSVKYSSQIPHFIMNVITYTL